MIPANAQEKLTAFRQEFVDELPALAREMIDMARAENTTQAYEKVLNTAMKVVEGMQVAQKADPYANLPVIHMHIGSNTITTVVKAPAIQEAPGDVIDVEATLTPMPALENAPEPSEDELAVLADLDLAASAMALD